jgi:hypothetical protein
MCQLLRVGSFGLLSSWYILSLSNTTTVGDQEHCHTQDFCVTQSVYCKRWGYHNTLFYLTLSLLMSYIYGAPCRARNLTYIYGRDFLMGILLLEPCIWLIYAWKTNKYNNYSFSFLIMWCVSTTSLDTTRPYTIFYRLLLNWASLRRH